MCQEHILLTNDGTHSTHVSWYALCISQWWDMWHTHMWDIYVCPYICTYISMMRHVTYTYVVYVFVSSDIWWHIKGSRITCNIWRGHVQHESWLIHMYHESWLIHMWLVWGPRIYSLKDCAYSHVNAHESTQEKVLPTTHAHVYKYHTCTCVYMLYMHMCMNVILIIHVRAAHTFILRTAHIVCVNARRSAQW